MNMRSRLIRGADFLTHAGPGAQRLLVLVYHRVLPRPDPMYPDSPDVDAFAVQVATLAQDFHVLPLDEALALQQAGRLPRGAVSITFDDGFADNVTAALPVLLELGLHATFFIATGYLDGGFMFNDAVIEACRRAPPGRWVTGVAELGDVDVVEGSRVELAGRLIGSLKYLDCHARQVRAQQLLQSVRATMPVDLMMTRAQLRQLHACGMHVGAHTRSHPILARLSPDEAEQDIAAGRVDLEDIIGGPVRLFAYPNGQPGRDYGLREVAMVRRLGFDAALSTSWGYADGATDRMQIPRVGSWGDPWRFSARLVLTRATARGAVCA